ncbi:hypothetical protein LU11_gp373 [Pseudomonas phage Lu11]|uniref:hypothetical protein n=1 Tax=Pseudomonas phage Lu11 TaxID=1161927 RepID=UPI00025F18D2|nr:hypothetical protein LU11_gp373 [Pseudomonas phage Lu11]AFH14904.1 hypothetical protein Lu11_0366 [Pseudomonas phage Lu11]
MTTGHTGNDVFVCLKNRYLNISFSSAAATGIGKHCKDKFWQRDFREIISVAAYDFRNLIEAACDDLVRTVETSVRGNDLEALEGMVTLLSTARDLRDAMALPEFAEVFAPGLPEPVRLYLLPYDITCLAR